MVRQLGIGLAIVFRIVLLFVLYSLIEQFQDPFWVPQVGAETTAQGGHGEVVNVAGILDGKFNFHSVIVLLGGVFISCG